MEKKKKYRGIIAVFAIIGFLFTLAVCDDGSVPGNGHGPNPNPGPGNEVILGSVFLGGSFNGLGAGGGVFKVNHVVESENGGRSARSAVERTDALVPLLGSIEDNGKFFELSGFMDPDTRQFFIGGGKDDLVYSITGSMDENDQLEISFIDIRQKDLLSGEWDAQELPFTRNDNITAPTRPAPTAAGIPSFLWGKWTDLPTCYTCGAPLPCPENHLGCPCDNGNYCNKHPCDDCDGIMHPCPLHCGMCRNGNWCSEHPCPDCGQWGNPPCQAHCFMCRNGNYCNDHPCLVCPPGGFPPCQAHCDMCKWGLACPTHNPGGGTGGGDRPGEGGDKRSVRTSLLLLNASKSVNARSVALRSVALRSVALRSVALRSVALRSVGSIMAASEEDQESIIISQFGISKSRPWMEYLREKADEQYQEFLAGNTGDNELIIVPGHTDSRKYWKATDTYCVFYNGGGNGNSLEDMAVLDILAEAYGYPNRTAYLAALRHRFENEAETQIKADDINFLEYWEEDGKHNILGYKKEFESVWTWSEANSLIASFGQLDMASADNDRIRPLLNGIIETVLEEYMARTEEEAAARETAWMTWWQGGMNGEEPVRTYRGTEECPWPTITTPKGRILSFGDTNTLYESNGNNYWGNPWGVYLAAYPDYITPAEQWPSIQFNGKTLKIYGGNLYLNDICVGDTGFWSVVSIIENDPDYRGYKFGDNVYVRVSVTNDDGIISIGELDAYGWENAEELAPEPPEWWVEGTDYENGESGNWPYTLGEKINVSKLVKKSIHEAKEMDVWAGRKIMRW